MCQELPKTLGDSRINDVCRATFFKGAKKPFQRRRSGSFYWLRKELRIKNAGDVGLRKCFVKQVAAIERDACSKGVSRLWFVKKIEQYSFELLFISGFA